MKKKYDDDDNRQIADMSETYDFSPLSVFGGFRKRHSRSKPKKAGTSVNQPPLTKQETRKIMFNALLGGLLIGTVFIVIGGLFILVLVLIW